MPATIANVTFSTVTMWHLFGLFALIGAAANRPNIAFASIIIGAAIYFVNYFLIIRSKRHLEDAQTYRTKSRKIFRVRLVAISIYIILSMASLYGGATCALRMVQKDVLESSGQWKKGMNISELISKGLWRKMVNEDGSKLHYIEIDDEEICRIEIISRADTVIRIGEFTRSAIQAYREKPYAIQRSFD